MIADDAYVVSIEGLNIVEDFDELTPKIEKALRQKNGRIARKLPDLDAHQSDEHQHNNGCQHDLEDLQKSMDPVNDLFSQSLHSFF